MATVTKQNYQRIWRTARLIPMGKVASYGQIADLAGLPKRARLVGRCLKYVPESENVPWHRVLKSNGQLAFAAGTEQAQLQAGLLQQEDVVVINNRVKLKTFQWSPNLTDILCKLEY